MILFLPFLGDIFFHKLCRPSSPHLCKQIKPQGRLINMSDTCSGSKASISRVLTFNMDKKESGKRAAPCKVPNTMPPKEDAKEGGCSQDKHSSASKASGKKRKAKDFLSQLQSMLESLHRQDKQQIAELLPCGGFIVHDKISFFKEYFPA